MKKISQKVLAQARKQLAQLGNAAFKRKTTEKQRQAWRMKGVATIKRNAKRRLRRNKRKTNKGIWGRLSFNSKK